MRQIKKVISFMSLAVAPFMLASFGLTLHAEAVRVYSEEDAYPETHISSPEGQFIMESGAGAEWIYTLYIADLGELAGGGLRFTVESMRNDSYMRTAALGPVILTQNGARIPAAALTVGQLWSAFWNLDLDDPAVQDWMESTGTADSPMTAERVYILPVAVGTNEFTVTDSFHAFKININVAGPRPLETGAEAPAGASAVSAVNPEPDANPPTGAGFPLALPAVLTLAAAAYLLLVQVYRERK